jgi:hypothetical protein
MEWEQPHSQLKMLFSFHVGHVAEIPELQPTYAENTLEIMQIARYYRSAGAFEISVNARYMCSNVIKLVQVKRQLNSFSN